MIFQLCNICSTSLRMATARTWYFGCALTWNMIMLSRKLVSLASLAKKQKHSPLAWWNSKDHLCNTNGKMPPPRNHEENCSMVCALCIGEHGEKAKRKINAKEEKQVVDDYSKLLLLQPAFAMWGYLSTIPSPLGTHLSEKLLVIPFLDII